MVFVREATSEDIHLLVPLMREMGEHYRSPALDDATIRERIAFGLAPPAGAFLIAVEDGKALAFATLYELFPGTGLAPACYLKELFVAEGARGKKVGERLMRKIARRAIARGATRLDFGTGSNNLGAQRFYGRLGAAVLPRISYRVEAEALSALAEDGPDRE